MPDRPEVKDWFPAVMNAQSQWISTPDPFYKYKGFSLYFGPTEYDFSDPIKLIRGMSLIGSGGAGWFAGTILRFPKGKHGIMCDHAIPSGNPAIEGRPGGDWSIVERLHIEGGGGTSTDGSVAHGIIMNGRLTVRDCYITQFSGDGIHSEAVAPNTNANVWQVQNCRIDNCENGLFLDPSDTNAGCAIALDSSSNRGWGVFDNSFIGNTYLACHTPSNKKGSYWCARPAGHQTTLSVFLNCYAEGDQPRAEIVAPSIVLGGVMDVQGSAIWMSPDDFKASFHNGIRAFGVKEDGKPLVAGYLGSQVLSAALELHVSNSANYAADPTPYRLIYERRNQGWWELNWGNADGSTPLKFSTGAAPEGVGGIWFENGYYVGGNGMARLKVVTGHFTRDTSGVWNPDSGALLSFPNANWNIGDQVLNDNPKSGDYAGWICVKQTQDSNAAVWNPFGKIEQ